MKKIRIKNMPELPYSTEESINRLRINLNFLGKDMKKIMVISSLENEGKSFVAFHVWRQMAQSGIHSVLIDADLRKSVMAEKYQMQTEGGGEFTGTSHVLARGISMCEAVWHTEFEQGDILPNTENLINPAMLLKVKRLRICWMIWHRSTAMCLLMHRRWIWYLMGKRSDRCVMVQSWL